MRVLLEIKNINYDAPKRLFTDDIISIESSAVIISYSPSLTNKLSNIVSFSLIFVDGC
jgi:hypothetical protein